MHIFSQRNLFGTINKKYLFIPLILFCTIISCVPNQSKSSAEAGEEIINKNMNLLLDSLFVFDDSRMDVEIEKKIEKDNTLSHNDIFGISRRIKKQIPLFEDKNIYEFDLKENYLVLNDGRKAYIRKVNKEKLSPPILGVKFSNFYLNSDENEAFLIVNKGIKGGIGQKLEIYYFKKIKGKWLFQNKDVLLRG